SIGGTITVQAMPNGGTLASVSICSGGSGSITVTGHSGTIISWEFSTDNGATWTTITNNTISQAFTNVTTPILYRVKVGNGCGYVYSNAALVGIRNYWTGTINTDWNTGGNWSDNQIPSTTCANVYIPGGSPNVPILSSGTASIVNLYIFPGASLTVNNATLQIAGDINNAGIFDVTNGTLDLNGTFVSQMIGGSLFTTNSIKNLVVSNDVSISSGSNEVLNITGKLSFGTSTSTLTTSDNLVIRSTALATASVGKLNNGNIITGNVTVERYIPNHSKAWQFLAVPVGGTQTVNEAWQDTATFANQNRYPGFGTMLTSHVPGAVSLGFDVFTPAGPSIKVYNSATNNYIGIASTKFLPITNPKGYMVLVRGDRSVIASNQAATATTLHVKGKLYTPADAPATMNVAAGTFESIGNPYASAIDFSLVSKTGGVQTDFFYMWDPKLTTTTGAGANSAYGLGGFQTFSWNGSTYNVTPGGGSYSGTNRNIESGQAFFVRAPFTAGTVSFNESCKVDGSNNVNRITSDVMQLRTSLHVSTAGGQVLLDGNLVQFGASFSNSVDMYDALKLNNSSENVGLMRNGTKLAVERRSEILSTDTIFFNLSQVRVQQYSFEFIATGLGQSELTAFLEDNYLHTSTPVNLDGTSNYSFNIINEAGSYAADRFRIVFKKLAPLPVTITSISASRNTDKTIAVSWKVESETSMQLYTVERSADGRNFNGIITAAPTANNGGRSAYTVTDISALSTDNFYRVKALSLSGLVQYSAIVKIAPLRSLPSIEVYPNPVTGRIIQVEFTGQVPGTYKLSLINNNGQSQFLTEVYLTDARSTHAAKLPQVTASGIYRLQITGPGNSVVVKTVHITE
ncbi:MAG: T9SS type A sorting domain-containing protein, partial [Ferruginibacter sp.]